MGKGEEMRSGLYIEVTGRREMEFVGLGDGKKQS
jgi:hypothetical protein